jgi:bifunctional UDP-N-acetylglucosamine pyrophosphorylase/glucosamine-1-phosphate N-acetyltransferase
MQAVILAAGQSTRTHPLTVNRPKPLLEVLDRTILEHNLDQLVGLVDDVMLVVGYEAEQIIGHIGDSYRGLRITYVRQTEQRGTGHALEQAKPHLADRFMVLNGDDLFAHADLAALAELQCGLLVAEVDDITRFGAVHGSGSVVTAIDEKPTESSTNLANTGAYVLDSAALAIELQPSERGELEIIDYLAALTDQGRLRMVTVTEYWLPVGYPWDYLEANVALLRRVPSSEVAESAVIEDGVHLDGTVVIGPGTVVRSGTYVEGPVWIGEGCVVGPLAYLRPDTVLLDGVRTRAEIVDSVLMHGVTAKHDCYIGHSVIGERCNIAAGTITADYRHDGATNWSVVNGRRVDSGRRKLGAFLGDDVRLGIGTLTYPGRKIWPGRTTLPGQVVEADMGPSGV